MLAIEPPVHPGEYLREEYLGPLGLDAAALADRLHVPRPEIDDVLACAAPVTPATALRLGKLFGTTPQFWLNFQTSFDLATQAARMAVELDAIEAIEPA